MTSFEIGRREQVRASPRANGDRLLRLFEANHQFFGRRHAGDRPERSEDAAASALPPTPSASGIRGMKKPISALVSEARTMAIVCATP